LPPKIVEMHLYTQQILGGYYSPGSEWPAGNEVGTVYANIWFSY
jgi:hypothetical protein